MDSELGFHSLRTETKERVSVEGSLPDWLTGSLIRNGPGTFNFPDGNAVDHWFDGLAMLSRFSFIPDDQQILFQNRFLQTDSFKSARRGDFDGGFATGQTTLRARLKTFFSEPYDNTNIITERIGNSFYALTESPRSVEFDPRTLEMKGHFEYDGEVPTGQLHCAHYKRDPATGSLIAVDTEFGRTSKYHIYAIESPQDRSHIASVETEKPAYMHSFGLTPQYVILTEFPLRLNPLQFLRPGTQEAFIQQFDWEPTRGTVVHLVDRTTGTVKASPVLEPLFGFHHVNAYESNNGQTVVFDIETVPDDSSIESLYLENLRAGQLGSLAGKLRRVTIELAPETESRYGPEAPKTTTEVIYDDGTALPTVSPAQWNRKHRYIYAMSLDEPITEWATAVMKHDIEQDTTAEFAGVCDYFTEPIFVPSPEAEHQDSGVVIVVGLDVSTEHSHLVVLDGSSFTLRAHSQLPVALPFDFHGRYFPNIRAQSA
jgi:beta-carotene 15,15'-monooxygenase